MRCMCVCACAKREVVRAREADQGAAQGLVDTETSAGLCEVDRLSLRNIHEHQPSSS